MKKAITVILVLLILCITNVTFAQNSTEGIEKVESLVKNRQYNSAFKLLNEIDPENNNPKIVLEKIYILLNYNVDTTMYQDFGLKDLKENEILEQLREKEGVYSNYKFEINTILEKLIGKYPTNWDLYKTLGDYYFEVFIIYDDKWIKSKDELLKLIELYYYKAEQNNVFDIKSLNALGYIQLQKSEPDKSITYFFRALNTDQNNPDTNYYLACAYFQLGKNDEGLKYANTSLNIYADYANKAGEARLMAGLCSNKKDSLNAKKYYKILDKLRTYSYYKNLVGLLELYSKKTDLKSATIAADALFSIDLSSHSLLLIWDVYRHNGFDDEWIKFIERMEIKYAAHDEVFGNLLLTKAFFYKGNREWNRAKQCFKKARERFAKCYKQEPDRFRLLDRMIESEEFQIEYIQFEEANKTKK